MGNFTCHVSTELGVTLAGTEAAQVLNTPSRRAGTLLNTPSRRAGTLLNTPSRRPVLGVTLAGAPTTSRDDM
jgi:hypothetical protein